MLTVEFRGGLGDVFWGAYHTDNYAVLDQLAPVEGAVIIVISHNPASVELFRHHRNAARFRIIDPEWGRAWTWPDLRAAYGLVQAPRCPLLRRGLPVTFYPAPADAEVLRAAAGRAPYVVLSASAGDASRNLPPALVAEIIRALTAHGYGVVAVGRNYPSRHGTHREERIAPGAGVVDLTDRLSAPGLVELVRGAAGVVCCHSAVCMLAWYLRRPTLVLYPASVTALDFARESPFGFGKDYPECVHGEFGPGTLDRIGRFLAIMQEARNGDKVGAARVVGVVGRSPATGA